MRLADGLRPDLYIHLPAEACETPLPSWKGSARPYVDCLEDELRLLGLPDQLPVRSVYIGSGGPGVAARLDEKALRALLALLKKRFDLSSCEQATVELDFSKISERAAGLLAGAGFSRATGLFPLEPETPALAEHCRSIARGVRLCRKAGFRDINLDLTADRARLKDSLSSEAARRLRSLRPGRIQIPDDWPERSAAVRKFRKAIGGLGGRGPGNIQSYPEPGPNPVLGLGWGARSFPPGRASGRDGSFWDYASRAGASDGDKAAHAAELAVAAGKRSEASKRFGRALKCYPRDLRLLASAAETAARAGEEDIALDRMSKAVRLSKDAALLRRAASLFAELGASESVLDCLGHLLKVFPKSPDLWVGRALHSVRLGRTRAARESLRRACRLDPGPWVLRRAAEVYGALGEHERALELCRSLTGRFPEELEFRISHAFHALASGQEVEGRRALSAAQRLRRKGAKASNGALRRMAASHTLAGEHGAAADIFAALAAMRPRDGELWLDLAYYQRRAGNCSAALRSLKRAAGLPLPPAPRRRAAGLFSELGEHAQAGKMLRSLSARGEEDVSLKLEEAAAVAQGGDAGRARRLLLGALEGKLRPEQRRAAAHVFQTLGDFKDAARTLKPLLKSSAHKAEALKDRGICRHLAGDPEGAVRDLEAALRSEPGLISACISLGSIHESAGRFAQAVQAYKRGLRAVPRAGEEAARRVLLDCLRALARKLQK